jgi:hypothetical protein
MENRWLNCYMAYGGGDGDGDGGGDEDDRVAEKHINNIY